MPSTFNTRNGRNIVIAGNAPLSTHSRGVSELGRLVVERRLHEAVRLDVGGDGRQRLEAGGEVNQHLEQKRNGCRIK